MSGVLVYGREERYIRRVMTNLSRLAGLILAAGLGWQTGASPAATAATRPLTIYVEVQGSLQGVKNDELSRVFTAQMTRAQVSGWQFEPTGVDAPHAPNRVEWSLIPGSDAAGEVRTFGFSRAMMGHLYGSHRVVRIEARVFLNNAYQGMVSGQIHDGGDPQDPEIVNEVSQLTRELMSPAVVGAESGRLDRRSDSSPS
jgi:hypothetical protein